MRLLVKLPALVPITHMTRGDAQTLEARLKDLMARMTQMKLLARYFSLSEEYRPNPHAPPPLPTLLSDEAAAGDGGGGGGGGAEAEAPAASA